MRARRQAEPVLRPVEDVRPEGGLGRGLELRQVVERAVAAADVLGAVVEQVEARIEQGRAHRPAVDEDVALLEMPAARPDDEGRDLIVQPVRLALGAVEPEVAANGRADRDLAADDVRPAGAERVLEVGHEDPRAGVQGVDHHLRLGWPGDLDAAIGQRRGSGRNRPVAGSDVGGRRVDIEVQTRVDRGLAIPASLEQRLSPRAEARLEVAEERQRIRRQDVGAAGCRVGGGDLDHPGMLRRAVTRARGGSRPGAAPARPPR